MSDHFTCSICGQEHKGLVTDWGYKFPDVVWKIAEPERAEKARFNDDLCRFGERYFIRCVLGLPFIETSGQFGWGAWAQVDWQVFKRYMELWNKDGSVEPVISPASMFNLPLLEQVAAR